MYNLINHSVKFKEWKTFIHKNGYRPRVTISTKAARETGMTKSAQNDEIILGKWEKLAANKVFKWEKSSQKNEFQKLRIATPPYYQKIQLDIINELKSFIMEKGYRPRVSI